MKEKPLLFISHITEEKELALSFKNLVETNFLGMLEVFVSSDENSISMGQKWLNNITDGLKKCAIEIVICSPKSIQRPWINFEAGAGWVRDIPVIPLCHSGMEPSQLPMPLNLLQAAKANEVSSLKLVFPVLAKALGANNPATDFTDFVNEVKEFEAKYTFWDSCNHIFRELHKIHFNIIDTLKSGNDVALNLMESDISGMHHLFGFLKHHNIADFVQTGVMEIRSHGAFYVCKIVPLPKLSALWNDTNFVFKNKS